MILRRRGETSEVLVACARTSAAAIGAAAHYFDSPSTSQEGIVKQARHGVRRVRAALGRPTGTQREILSAAVALLEAAEQSCAAVDEVIRFEMADALNFMQLTKNLHAAAGAALQAVEVMESPRISSTFLIQAKAQAAQVERVHRIARRAAIDNTNTVAGLKSATVLRRLSRAADEVQQAVETITGILAIQS